MATIFTKIINGDIPSYKVAENDDFIAFLDIHPLRKGHTLVVPKKEIDYIFDHEDDTLQQLIIFSKHVAKGIEKVVPCERIGLTVIGLEVPHTHIHLIPINSITDMTFGSARPQFTEEEMQETATAIAEQIDIEQCCESEFSYEDYLALLLIYIANTSEGISQKETDYIQSKVGKSHYEKANRFFKNKSEFATIQKIDDLSERYAHNEKRDEVFTDIEELIVADGNEDILEKHIFKMLKRMI